MKQTPDQKQKVTKTIAKLALPLMACAVMLYSSCRKSDLAPAPAAKAGQTTNAPSNEELSKQIVANLAHSLSGGYGGASMMKGLDSLNLAGHKGLESSLLCGFFTDSLVDRTAKQGDTTSHLGGELTFAFTCDNGKPTGYSAYDSLATTRQVPNGWYQQYYIKQAYTIKCLDDKHQFIGVNGDNYFYQYMNLICDCGKSAIDIENCNFVLHDLKIDICKKDILSGTADFTANGNNWHVEGTLVFIGNHLANVTIGGNTFQIDTRNFSW